MEVLCGLARWSIDWHNYRPGGAISEKWRILDGNEGKWSDLIFGASRWSPPSVSIKARVDWVRMNKHLNVLMHTGYMESPNWVASCATKIEAILPYLTDVKWDSAWATHGVSAEAYAWKTWTRVRWALIISLTSSWIVATHGVLRTYVCHVVRFILLQGWLLIRMSGGLFAAPKCRIINFIIMWW
jgi:hypothetical protein